MPIEAKAVSAMLESAQTKVEGFNFDIRKNVVEYDDVIAAQRSVIYADRQNVLERADMHDRCMQMMEHEINRIVAIHTQANMPEDWDLDGIVKLFDSWGVPIPDEAFPEYINRLSRNSLTESLLATAEEAYAHKEQEVTTTAEELELPETGESIMRRFERYVVLQVVDSLWRDHIDHLDVLRVGIQLRGIAQRDPLVEFKSEAYNAFEQLKEDIEHHVTEQLFRSQIYLQAPAPQALPENLKTNVDAIAAASGQAKGAGNSSPRPTSGPSSKTPAAGANNRQYRGGKGLSSSRHGAPDRRRRIAGNAPGQPGQPQGRSATTVQKAAQPQRTGAATSPASSGQVAKPGRNDPCYCGSGRKYKLCHGR